MSEIRKYPRTRHVQGSRLQHGDHDLEAAHWSELASKHLVIEEKVDGANCGISFSENAELLLQSRGHYLRGGRGERHFDLLKQWAACHQEAFYCALGSRYVMYGEWLYAKHTYFYDALPHYFMEFDVLDTETGNFLSTPARRKLLSQCPVRPVRVLSVGPVDSVKEMSKLVTRSNFITPLRLDNLISAAKAAGVFQWEVIAHTDMDERMEGLYVKWEEDGIVKGRYKFVRDTFTNSILDQETHWHDRPIIQNRLVDGGLEEMFRA